MIIQSKRNEDKIIEVSLEEWNKMKANQTARHWRLLSSRDVGPQAEPPPLQEVISFMNSEPEVKKIYDEEGDINYDGMFKSELITECEKEGIELTGKELKSELIELLINKV